MLLLPPLPGTASQGGIVLLADYEPTLVEGGWLTKGQEHLAWPVLAVSAVGVGWLWSQSSRRLRDSDRSNLRRDA